MSMLSNKQRLNNKSKGPWGMKNFNFTYRQIGEEMQRHRFITAPTEEGATQQFKAVMKKLDLTIEVLAVEEIED